MIVPYENYLKFLVIKHRNLEEIHPVLSLQGFCPPPAAKIKKLHRSIFKVSKKGLRSYLKSGKKVPDKRSFMEWMKDLGIQEIWTTLPAFARTPIEKRTGNYMAKANALLRFGKAREQLEVLSLARADDKDICQSLNEKYGINIPVKSVTLFRKYYWDIDNLAPDDLWTYIATVKANKKKRSSGDSLYDLAGEGSEYIKWRLGVEEELDTDKMIDNMVRDAYFKYKESIKHLDIETSSKAAKAFADIVQKAKEIKISQAQLDSQSPDMANKSAEISMLMQSVILSLSAKEPRGIDELMVERERKGLPPPVIELPESTVSSEVKAPERIESKEPRYR